MATKFYTEEEDEIIKRLWDAGHTAQAIGDHIDRPRNSVLGRLFRLGLSGKRVKSSRSNKSSVKLKKLPKPKPTPVPNPLPVVMEQKSNPPLKGIHELEPKDCRFPIGDPRESGFGFCGKPVSSGRVYCRDHLLESVNRDHRKRLAAILGETEGMEEAA